MKLLVFSCLLVQTWRVKGLDNRTRDEKNDVVLDPHVVHPETPLWFYLPAAIGVVALMLVIFALYRNRKHRVALKRRRREEHLQMNISVPVPSTVTSLGNASVVSMAPCTVGNPHLKSKMLHTFSDGKRIRSPFENNMTDGDSGSQEDYINSKDFNHGQNSFVSVCQPNIKGQNLNNSMASRRVENIALKDSFIPPAISVELVRRKSQQDALMQDWGRGKEQLIHENQNSASAPQGKSFGNLGERAKVEQQPIYVNNHRAFLKKEMTEVDQDNQNNQQIPELPLKQRQIDAARRDKSSNWVSGSSPNFKNVFGGDLESVGGSRQRGAIYNNNRNETHFIGHHAASTSNMNEDEDYENMRPEKETISTLAPWGSHAVQKVPLRAPRRLGTGFTREENKAVRRSKSNVEAMLKPPEVLGKRTARKNEGQLDGHGVFESKGSVSNETHYTNTESLMQLLGLPININCSFEQVQTFQGEDYLSEDDYDDNCS